jgi:hypothetical protein
MHTRRWILIGSLALALAGVQASHALNVDNYFMPVAGGSWSDAPSWSLGHPPTSSNDAFIEVSGAGNKAVYYNAGSAAIGMLTIDGGSTGLYGALWQLQDSLITEDVRLGNVGPAWHWMEADAFLWVQGHLYVGYQDPGPGHFYLAVQDYGVLVSEDTYVGYSGPGDFDHYDGYHACQHLFVGQNDAGTYWLKGDEETSTLLPEYYIIVGNGDVGLFEQTGGTVVNDNDHFVSLGLNAGGEGTYLMKGGVLNANFISIAYIGDGYFTQSGGTVNTTSNVNIGVYDESPHRAWYKLNEADGTAALNIGGDLNVGQGSLAKYEQTGGIATIAGDLNIYEDPYSGTYSYVYMGTSAGTLEVDGTATNHSGYYDQDGGIFTTPNFVNDSPYGFNIDNSADFRATNVEHNAGTFYMWRNAIVRGEYAGAGFFWACNFTNNANVQMGNASFNGGTFQGHLINNGSFNYTQGDFSDSRITNYGTVNLNAPFTCNRIVQNAYSFTVTPTAPITARGVGYASAFESNDNLTIQDGATITVVNAPLVSNGALYGGGAVIGDVENNDYLLPSTNSDTGEFYINGDFTQSSTGLLRVRLGGNSPVAEFDRLRITGHGTLGGTLQVLLIDEFTPSLGDNFRVVIMTGGRTGDFDTVSLPALPDGLEWEVEYTDYLVQLNVVEPQGATGDLNCDGLVTAADIDPFVLALTGGQAAYEAQYPDCNYLNADCNDDGVVSAADIDPFVGLLTGG